MADKKEQAELKNHVNDMFDYNEHTLDFSASVTPLIAMQCVLVFVKFLNCANLIREIRYSPFVWLYHKLG